MENKKVLICELVIILLLISGTLINLNYTNKQVEKYKKEVEKTSFIIDSLNTKISKLELNRDSIKKEITKGNDTLVIIKRIYEKNNDVITNQSVNSDKEYFSKYLKEYQRQLSNHNRK